MSDAFGKIVAILISVAIMFIAPVVLYSETADNTKNTYVFTTISEFVNEVENTGVISSDRYNMFINMLSNLKSGYNIEITHMKNDYINGEYIGSVIDNDEIIQSLDNESEHRLKKGDFIKVTVKRKEKIVCFYGGGIKNEDY